MSPWWTRPARAHIEPGRARLGPEAQAAAEPGWRGALGALEALLAARPCRRLRLVVSNHFVRYLVVPWDRTLVPGPEREAYLRHHFSTVYGERAAQWTFAVERAGGASRLAAAMDRELIEAAPAMAARRGSVLAALEPYAISAYNEARRRLGEQVLLFAVLEAERTCALLVSGATVLRVANRRAADPRAELARVAALEAAALGAAGELPLHLAGRPAA